MKELLSKIQSCKTMPELDELRLVIVRDKENFVENQMAFRKKLNQLKRVPSKDRTW